MTERELIRRRRSDWEQLAELVEQARQSGLAGMPPESLASIGPLYRRTVSDLSLARTHFPESQTTGYLNQLVARTHTLIYGGGKMSWRGFLRFFTRTFPQAVRQRALLILLMGAVFTAGALAGAWAYSTDDPAFGSSLRLLQANERAEVAEAQATEPASEPEEYDGPGAVVEEQGSAASAVDGEGDAFVEGHVGGGDSRSDMDPTLDTDMMALFSSYIMVNNIRVSLLAFGLGITFGVGTLWVLWTNGFLVGYLAADAHATGEALRFWSLVLPHGVLELPAIFICGAAGWMIGWALLCPGERRRLTAAREAARKGLVLLGGCVSVLVVAALIEGFITPSGLSPGVKLSLSAVFFLLFSLYMYRAGRGVVRGAST